MNRRRLKAIRQDIYKACSALHSLCDELIEAEEEPAGYTLSGKDTDALLSGLHNLFQQSGDAEQIRILTISPDSWGRSMIQKWFNCSQHQARQALWLKRNKGVLAFPEYSRGNKPLSDATVTLVTEFFLQDGISRASSRKKDVIYINKLPVPIRFMVVTGREAFQQFVNENPSVDIAKSSFYALKPRQIKYNAPLDTCLCIYHENMQLLLKGWKKLLKNSLSDAIADFDFLTESYLVGRFVCTNSREDCYYLSCSRCSMNNPSGILLENVNVNMDDDVSWSQWVSSKNVIELHHINGSVNSLLNEIDSQWARFLLHWHTTTEQNQYIKTIRMNSSETTYIVVQVDFAENFKIFQQREVQGCHWNNQQVTIFTAHLKIGSSNKNIVIISDCMTHNTSFVYVAQSLITDFIKSNFPLVKTINYLSDGAGSQFKNNYNMLNLIHHKKDFQLDACWTFTSTAHGKGPCDGLGASVKCTASRSIASSGVSISSAKQFFEFTVHFNERAARASASNGQPPIHTFYVESSTVETVYNNVLKPRWEKLSRTDRIKNIRAYHQFDITSDYEIQCRLTSNSNESVTFMSKITTELQSTLQPVQIISDVTVGMFVIIPNKERFFLAKISMINRSTQEIQLQYYEPPFPSTTFHLSLSKTKEKCTCNIHDIAFALRQNPTVDLKNEVHLNSALFNDIENKLDEQ